MSAPNRKLHPSQSLHPIILAKAPAVQPSLQPVGWKDENHSVTSEQIRVAPCLKNPIGVDSCPFLGLKKISNLELEAWDLLGDWRFVIGASWQASLPLLTLSAPVDVSRWNFALIRAFRAWDQESQLLRKRV